MYHPAAKLLWEWAQFGYPGKPTNQTKDLSSCSNPTEVPKALLNHGPLVPITVKKWISVTVSECHSRKETPAKFIDQLGFVLQWIIKALIEVDEENAKTVKAKFDMDNGF